MNNYKIIKVEDGIEGLIFDCDGTLADSLPSHRIAWESILHKNNITDYDFSFIRSLTGMTTEGITNELNKKYNLSLDGKILAKTREKLFLDLVPNIHEITPVVDVARRYYKKLKMAVASGGSAAQVIATLKHLNIFHLFDAIITADDPVAAKPSPDIFLYAAKKINVAPAKCQVFEDGALGLLAAKRAGMVAFDVTPYI